MRNRNVELTMDHLSGATFESLSIKYGIHTSRAHQIVKKMKELCNWVPWMTKEEFGCILARRYEGIDPTNGPEMFYWRELEPHDRGMR